MILPTPDKRRSEAGIPSRVTVAGIGIGPFNLGLAALLHPIESAGASNVTSAFFDQRPAFSWHSGMLLSEATIQVPFLADLTTMADPTSPFTFLNYLKTHGRIHPFYIRESFYPLREEYDDYCRWVAAQLDNLHWSQRVVSIERNDSCWTITLANTGSESTLTVEAEHVVLGIGTEPMIPASLRSWLGTHRIIHSEDYLHHKRNLLAASSVTVIGSGQSAAEIYRDLLEHSATAGTELNWVTRSPRFFPMEYSKLTLEMTSPEYVAHLRALSSPIRNKTLAAQSYLHRGISEDLINDIYDTLYRLSFRHAMNGRILTNVEVTGADTPDGMTDVPLTLRHIETGSTRVIHTDRVISATGYRPVDPDPLLGNSSHLIRRLDDGRLDVANDFSIDTTETLHVQNAEGHITGVNAPDLGMGPWRNSVLINRILGRTEYPTEDRFTFQDFDL